MAANLPEIVLLPGLDGTGDLFERAAGPLAGDFAVNVLRYPNDPLLGYAGYVELVRNAIGSREVFLLGESFSGPVAVIVAAQLKRQIKGLVLAATFVKHPWPSWMIRSAANGRPEMTPAWIRDAVLMGRYGDPELAKKVDDIVRNLSRPVRAARLRAVAGVDVRIDFARLRCPILALHGRHDWLVRVSLMQDAVSLKGGARMVVVPAAHMLLQTCAEGAAAEIANFAKSALSTETHHDA